MHARLGRIEDSSRLQSLEKVRQADRLVRCWEILHRSAYRMEENPSRAFTARLLRTTFAGLLGYPTPSQSIIEIPSQQGFAPSEVAELASQLGMSVQMARWTHGTDIPVPCIVDWKACHKATRSPALNYVLSLPGWDQSSPPWSSARSLEEACPAAPK